MAGMMCQALSLIDRWDLIDRCCLIDRWGLIDRCCLIDRWALIDMCCLIGRYDVPGAELLPGGGGELGPQVQSHDVTG